MKRLVPIIAAALLGAVPLPALAAVRTVQFAGVSGARTTYDETYNESVTGDCRITVFNVGTTPQIVNSVEFIDFGSNNRPVFPSAPVDSAKFDSTSPSSSSSQPTACTGSVANRTIQPGGFCMFRLAVRAVLYDGNWLTCGGRITVEDPADTAPGSVVAAGAMFQIQESVVLGGSLSGAYYASGVHLWNTSNLRTRYAGSEGTYNYSNSHNMNVYCTNACQRTGARASWCDDHCGHAGGGDPSGSFINTFSYMIQGMTVSNLELSTALSPDQGGWEWASNTPTSPPSYSDGSTSLDPSSGTLPRMAIRTANGHYAGGMVYEMAIGPMVSICSANKAFELRGGQDFTHAGGVDGHAVILGNRGPPERLVCNHRHAMDDLYLGVGQSTTFTINGGSPF